MGIDPAEAEARDIDPTTACSGELDAWSEGYRRGADTVRRRVVALLTAAGQHALAETVARITTDPPGAWTPEQEQP